MNAPSILKVSLALLPTALFAQAPSNSAQLASISASTTVYTGISITAGATGLAFGAVMVPSTGANGTVQISPVNGAATAGGTAVLPTVSTIPSSAALFTVHGNQNAAFSLTVPTNLTINNGATQLGVGSWQVSLNSGTAINVPVGGTLTTGLTIGGNGSASGTAPLGLGATLTVPAGTPAGAYSNTFNVTATYE